MTARADLEARLAASWDVDVLAVYGDLLTSEGDPRGELIAVDLRIVADGWTTPELAARRSELLVRLLGARATEYFGRSRRNSFEYGFADVALGEVSGLGLECEQALIDGPMGAYLRKVRVAGGEKHVRAGVSVLVRRARHDWLRTIGILYSTMASRSMEPIISKRMGAKLVAATPVLETVEVTRQTYGLYQGPPRPVFAEFVHPNVKRVEL